MGRVASRVHKIISPCTAGSQSSCEVSHSSCSHQVPEKKFLRTDVMHQLDDEMKNESLINHQFHQREKKT